MKKSLLNLKNVLLAIGVSAFFSGAMAQQGMNCGTDIMLQKIFEKYPDVKAQYDLNVANSKLNQNLAAKTASAEVTYTIPIVFHVLHQYGSENITDAQVIDEVNILNRDYMKLNADTANVINEYQPIIGKARIQFRLATIDPQGNCTNGIEHIYTHLTNQGGDQSKISQWPQNKYLNVWVVKSIGSQGVAGYAFYPSAIAGPYMLTVDGVIILHDYIGSIGTSATFSSRALTHEIGHYLGLPHTWGSTNDPEVACGDDGIPDTPETKGHSSCGNRYDAHCDSAAVTNYYGFTDVTLTSGTTDTTKPYTSAMVDFGHFSANGLSSNSSRDSVFLFNGWGTGGQDMDTTYASQTGSIDLNKYYEVTVTPKFGKLLSFSSLAFRVLRTDSSCRSFAVRSSVDGYASNLNVSALGSSTMSIVSGTTTASSTLITKRGTNEFFVRKDTTLSTDMVSVTTTASGFKKLRNGASVTFRIYGWNSEKLNAGFGIDSVVVGCGAGTIENVENYMEYSYCSKMFTNDQKSTMRSSLESNTANRANLVDTANLIATGTYTNSNSCAPKSDFYSNKRYVCMNNSVTFTAAPWRATATSYTWTFTNASVSTASTAVVNVSFNAPGWQNVSLTVGNANGTDTKTVNSYIFVSWPGNDYTGLTSEDFESATVARNNWYGENPENNEAAWHLVNNAGASGNHSFMLNNYKTSSTYDPYYYDRLTGLTDALISPSYNLNFTSSLILSFKISCATRAGSAADITDKLSVYKSTDCGATWNYAGTSASTSAFTGTNIANAGYYSGNYIPTSSTQWKTVNITLFGLNSSNSGNVRFKFVYEPSPNANNIFIDDININGTQGITENNADYFSLNVYPNPTAGDIDVDYFSHGKKVTISIVDVLGRTVYSTVNEGQTGMNTKTISASESNIKPGVYFVNVSDGNTTQTRKVIVN